MKKFTPWLILSLPLLALVLLWHHLPTTVLIHSANSDKRLNRDDFGGVVVAVTASVALLGYVFLQIESAFRLMTERRLNNTYIAIAVEAALIGFILISVGLLRR